jgi:outer membrane lipoprotein-sorting protein
MKKLTLALMLIAGVASGCSKVSEGRSGTGTPDPKAVVAEASHKLYALKALSGNIETVGETSFKQHVDFVAPDRYHYTYVDGTGAATEMIIIGDQSYVKDGDSWKKTDGQSAPPTLRNSYSDEVMRTLSDAHFEGEQTVNGKPALVYSYHAMMLVGNYPVLEKMWVAKDSGLPLKSDIENPSGVVKHMTITFDPQAPATIEPPIK